MPRGASWIHRIPKALESLSELSPPPDWIDRALAERLFCLSPRQALRVLLSLGARRGGNSAVLATADFVQALEALLVTPAVQREKQRRQRLETHMSQFRQLEQSRKVVLGTRAGLVHPRYCEGVYLSPGRLEVTFSQPEELLQKLWVLMEWISMDLDGFRRTTELPPSPETPVGFPKK